MNPNTLKQANGPLEMELDILNHVPIGVFVLQQDGEILFWNTCIQDWSGIPREKAVGSKIGDLFPHLDAPRYTVRLQSVFEYGAPVIFSSQLHQNIIPTPSRDGRSCIQHTTVTSIPTGDGSFYALFAIQDVTDLTHRIHEYRAMRDQALEEASERRRAEAALQASEIRYRTLFESAGDAIFIHDLDGHLLEVNQVACERLGYRREELLQMTVMDVDAPEFADLVPERIERLRQSGQIVFETTHVRRDGSSIPIELNSRIIEYRDAEAVLSVARDITERKWAEEALRESESRYRTLFDSAGDAIFIQDPEGYFLGVNRIACERLGYSREELLQMTLAELEPPEYAHLAPRRAQQLQQEGQISFETAHVRQDGVHVPVELNSRIIEYQGIPAVLTIARDITERKQAEAALQKARDELEIRVEERTAELKTSNEQLRQEIAERKRVEQALRESEEVLHRQLEELVILHSVATSAAEATDEDVMIERAIQAIGKILYPEDFGVLLLDEGQDVMRAHSSYRTSGSLQDLTIRLGQGIAGQVAADGQPRRISDTTQEPGYAHHHDRIRSALCVPLRAGDHILGVINAESQHPDHFTPADERLLTTFASQLATAIENVRLMETLEQRVADRTRELAALYDVTAIASESLNLEATLESLMERIQVAMRSEIIVIHLLDEKATHLQLTTHRGLPEQIVDVVQELPSRNGLLGWIVENRSPLMTPNLISDPRLAPEIHVSNTHTYLGVPMQAQGRVLGVLSVLRDVECQFSVEEIALLASIADHVAVAVENARLRQQAKGAAIIEERERLARELHDSVTQSLYSSTLFAEAGRELIKTGNSEEVEHYLTRIGETTQQALKEMRLLVYKLRPPALERQGLVKALRQRLEAVEKRAGIQAHLVAENQIELPAPVEEGLYRIAQEALNNSLKHARATTVTVHIKTHDDQIELQVTDDGIGFELDDADHKGGMGLSNIQERVEGMGGNWTIHSNPGEGTSVRVVVSLVSLQSQTDE